MSDASKGEKKLKENNSLVILADKLGTITEWIANFMLAVVVVVLIIQVGLRFFFKESLPWAEEVARYLMVWVVMLTGSILVKNQELITVDFFDKLWPEKMIKYRDLVYRVLLLVVFAVLVKEGWLMAMDARIARIASLNLSWFWPYLAIPVGSSLIIAQLVLLSIIEYREKRGTNP